ncbi:hypothetical protein Tco_0503135 [Tanacetum coccineum]
MQNPEDISHPVTAIDMALVLMAKEFKLNNTTPTNNNQKSSSNPRNMQIAQPGMNIDQDRHMLMVEDNVGNQFRPNAWQIAGNQNRYNIVQNVGNQLGHNAVQNLNIQKIANQRGNGNVKRDATYLQTQLKIAQKEEARIQLNYEEIDFIDDACAYDEIEEVNLNYTLKDNLQQASTLGTQIDSAPIYDSYGSVEDQTCSDTMLNNE